MKVEPKVIDLTIVKQEEDVNAKVHCRQLDDFLN